MYHTTVLTYVFTKFLIEREVAVRSRNKNPYNLSQHSESTAPWQFATLDYDIISYYVTEIAPTISVT